MNELRRILEDALSAAPPDSDTRALVGNALDMLDAIPMEPLEIMAKVERVRSNCRKAIRLLQPWIALNGGPSNNPFNEGKQAGIALALDYLREEFPDAKE